jgi:phenylacetate-CoA ligase
LAKKARQAQVKRPPVVPQSACRGIAWPAIPAPLNRLVLSVFHQIDRSQWLDAAALDALQLAQLRVLAAYAQEAVPFYRERLAFLKGEAKTFGMEAWRKIPLLSRVDIQNAGQELLSRKFPQRHGEVADVWTSGSTGRPVQTKGTTVTTLFLSALTLRNHLWHGRDLEGTAASIRLVEDAKLQATAEGKFESWVPAYGTGRALYQSIRLPVREQIAWLREVKPDYLVTYPSNLAAMLAESPKAPPGLRQVSTMGEALDPELPAQCRDAWGVEVKDIYSAQETGMIAAQCPTGNHYHIQSEVALVEILDAAGNPCAPGQIGRVVVTDLHNFATPLIRYDIGDYAEAGEPCACGRGLPVLKRIWGRGRNMLRLPSGDVIWPLFFTRDAEKEAGGIRQMQLVQTSLTHLKLRVVSNKPVSAAAEKRIKKRINVRMGHPFEVTVERMEEIPRSANGKYEDFISEIP